MLNAAHFIEEGAVPILVTAAPIVEISGEFTLGDQTMEQQRKAIRTVLSDEEKELLTEALRFANVEADVESALASTRSALVKYAKCHALETQRSPHERLADLQKLGRDTMHLGRFMGRADVAIIEVVHRALKPIDVDQFVDALAAISGRAVATAREIGRSLPNAGRRKEHPAESTLTLELAAIFQSATGVSMSNAKDLPFVRGRPWKPRSKKAAGRRFIEIVLRQVLGFAEADIEYKTLSYWLRTPASKTNIAKERTKVTISASKRAASKLR